MSFLSLYMDFFYYFYSIICRISPYVCILTKNYSMRNLLLSSLFTIAITPLFAQLTVKPIDDDGNTGVSAGDSPAYMYVNDVVLYVQSAVDLTENPTDATANPAGEFNGSIYLRGDGQLIQGDAVSANTGNGSISVYQTSQSDAHDYNLWMSPVSSPGESTTGNQTTGRQRIHDVNSITRSTEVGITTGLNGSSSTATGGFAAASGNMMISSQWTFSFDPINGFQGFNSNNNAPGRGFIMKGTNVSPHTGSADPALIHADLNVQQYDFRGRPNSGNITVPIYGPVGGEDRFMLTGNPYPSFLDLAAFFNDVDNIGKIDHIAFYEEDRSINSHFYESNKSGYGSWVPFGTTNPADPMNTGDATQGIYVPAVFLNYDSGGNPLSTYQIDLDGDMVLDDVIGETLNKRFSPIAQGFMIVGSSSVSGSDIVTFKNSHRVFISRTATEAGVFRNTDVSSKMSNQALTASNNSTGSTTGVIPGQILSEGNTTGVIPGQILPETSHMMLNAYFPGSHNRLFALGFSENTTLGFDIGYDSSHPMDATSEVYMPIMGGDLDKKLLTQGVPFKTDLEVPITITTDVPGSVLLNVAYSKNMPVDKAYLFDLELNTYQEITNDEVANVNLPEAGKIEGRFFIVFKSIEENSFDLEVSTGLSFAKKNIEVFQDNRLSLMSVLNLERLDVKELRVYDMTGSLVHTESNIGVVERHNIPTGTFADGAYLVKLTTKDNLILDYKVTIFNRG